MLAKTYPVSLFRIKFNHFMYLAYLCQIISILYFPYTSLQGVIVHRSEAMAYREEDKQTIRQTNRQTEIRTDKKIKKSAI